MNTYRLDLETIVGLVPEGARVLDLGCGDGTLLAQLVTSRQVIARGVELSEDNVRASIARGLSVRHGNIEEGLADYREDAFDYVILSQTLAYLDHPSQVVNEMLRVGHYAVISFENAGHWKQRLRSILGEGNGSTLVSHEPRQRAITLNQFGIFSRQLGAHIEKAVFLSGSNIVQSQPALRATNAIFVLSR
ncbi:MAG TPA: methionine biosynthesis protein MetW [Verrucomicrobia bacterium]|nr:MAG: hypothetical protein A2X46_07135 [Lentisphaerae bacterium GWF2_57_35]HBA85283.1 methionine biosynthesis protein MetW [Verrucomicrobiota bacterium]